MHGFFRLMDNHTKNGILNSSHCMGLTQTPSWDDATRVSHKGFTYHP